MFVTFEWYFNTLGWANWHCEIYKWGIWIYWGWWSLELAIGRE